MFSKYDRYYLTFMLIMISYITFRYFSNSSEYIISDILMLYFLAYIIWYLKICKRNFIMTREQLNKYDLFSRLRYCCYEDMNGHINKIYVRVDTQDKRDEYLDDDWYELDYDLTIPHDSYGDIYNNFISQYNTVGKLLTLMDKNYKIKYPYGYNHHETDYKFFKIASIILILLALLLNMIIYFNI